MITRTLDAQDGIIMVKSVRRASRAEIDTHYSILRGMISELRLAGRPVRLLSDQREAERLPDELNYLIKDQIERTFRPGDRVALLMRTDADQSYAREILGVADYAVFTSQVAAEMWLMETDQAPPTGE